MGADCKFCKSHQGERESVFWSVRGVWDFYVGTVFGLSRAKITVGGIATDPIGNGAGHRPLGGNAGVKQRRLPATDECSRHRVS